MFDSAGEQGATTPSLLTSSPLVESVITPPVLKWKGINPLTQPKDTNTPGELDIEKGCWVVSQPTKTANKTYLCKFCHKKWTCSVTRARSHFLTGGESGQHQLRVMPKVSLSPLSKK